MIPLGTTVPPSIRGQNKREDNLRLLFLGRLHPIKGLENLLRACKLLDLSCQRNWVLRIAGSGEPSYSRGIQKLSIDLGLRDRVEFLGRVSRGMLCDLFAQSDLTVVPSYSENFGHTVVESLAHAVPVIVSDGTPWKRVEEIGCGIMCSNSPEELAKAIQRVSGLDLRSMGERGREWMKSEFSWSQCAKCVEDACCALLNSEGL